MAHPGGQSVVLVALKATATAITEWEWWKPGVITGAILFLVSGAIPVVFQFRFGVWRGVKYELSPFVADSLARVFLLPMLAVLITAIVVAVLYRLATETLRAARDRR
jgi:hypothetical protein